MNDYDFILICQSDVVEHSKFSKLPLDRIELFRSLIYPRMVRYGDNFCSHLDLLNLLEKGSMFGDMQYPERRGAFNIWNLASFNGLHLANYLSGSGIRTKIINNLDSEWDAFCEAYRQCAVPPLVGISTTFHLSWLEVRRISEMLRGVDSGMEIVLGGAFINAQTLYSDIALLEKPMREYKIDFVLHAFNSEEDLRDLILGRKNGREYSGVGNLAYFKNGDYNSGLFCGTEAVWHAPLLDEAPLSWGKMTIPLGGHTVQMRTSSGCPFECAFCSYPKSARGYKAMSIEGAEQQLESIMKMPGLKNIVFIDDTFNVPPNRFKKLCKIFSKFDFDWFSFLRVQYIDDEIACMMKDSGCKCVYLGLESASDAVLKNMNKKATRAEFLKGLAFLKKYDIACIAAFVLGFPGETEHTIKENLDFIENFGIDFYTLKEFYYMEHTPVHAMRNSFGLSGMGNNWSHDTMDYKTASRHKSEMFARIKNSVYIDADTNLWHIAYLYDRGFYMSEITEIQKQINAIMQAQMQDVFDYGHTGFGLIKEILQKKNNREGSRGQ